MTNLSNSKQAAFFRRAMGVVLSERGMSTACLNKLRFVGEQLQMSNAEFNRALAQLGNVSLSETALNRYESAFEAFLIREISRIQNDVLSLSMENRALAIAFQKYGIENIRARLILEAVCTKRNIERLSVDETEALVEQIVCDRLGKSTFVTQDLLNELQTIGLQWGVPRPRLEELIHQAVDENTQLLHSRHQRTRLLLGGLLAFVLVSVILGVTWVTGWIDWYSVSTKIKIESNSDNSSSFDLDGERLDSSKSDVTGDLLLKQFLQLPTIEILGRAIQKPEMSVEYFVSDTSLRFSEKLAKIANAICDLHAAASLRSTKAFVELVQAGGRDALRDLCLEPSFLTTSKIVGQGQTTTLASNQCFLLASLYEIAVLGEDGSEGLEAKGALLKTLEYKLGIDGGVLSDLGSMYGVVNTWVESEFFRIAFQAKTAPNQAAIRFVSLCAWCDAFDQWNKQEMKDSENLTLSSTMSRAALQILVADLAEWKTVGDDFLRHNTLSRADDWEIWIELGERIEHGFQDPRLLEEIFRIYYPDRRAGLETIKVDLFQVKIALRNARLTSVIDVNERTVAAYADMLKKISSEDIATISDSELPFSIAQALFVGNLEIGVLLTLEQRSVEYQLIDEHRGSWESAKLEIFAGVAEAVDSGGDNARVTKQWFESMEDFRSDDTALRERALRRLAEYAPLMFTVEWKDADELARYLLSDLDIEQRVNALKALSSLRLLSRVLVSLADILTESQTDADWALSLMQVVANQSIQYDSPSEWRRDFVRFMKRSALDIETTRNAADERRVSETWGRLHAFLVDSYKVRGQLSGKLPRPGLLANSSPLLAMALDDPAINPREVAAKMGFLESNTKCDFERDVWAQSVLVQKTIKSFGSESVAEQESDWFPLGRRMLATELMCVRTLDAIRKKSFERLLETGGY